MEVLFILIPVSVALAAASVVACLAAIRGGQYDDMESPRWRILFDGRNKGGAGAEAGGADVAREREIEHTGAQARRSTPE
jgi:cbb3-type cytochrome oxidase maturation protein